MVGVAHDWNLQTLVNIQGIDLKFMPINFPVDRQIKTNHNKPGTAQVGAISKAQK